MPDNTFTGSTKLTVRVAGNGLKPDEGYDLDAVISSLQGVENLVRKTYLIANDRSRFTDNDADSISIKLKTWRKGSLISDLSIDVNNIVLPVLPFVVENKEFIWEIIKDSVKFLRVKLKAEKGGKVVETETIQTINGDSAVQVKAEDNAKVTVNVYQGLPEVANKMQQPLQDLTDRIDGKNVENIDLSNGSEELNTESSEVINLTKEDKDLLGSSTFTSNEEVEIVGKIVSGNYESNSGKITIVEASTQDLQPGKSYRLRISDELHVEEKWREMFLYQRPYYCKYTLGGSTRNKVIEVIITDWDESKWNDDQAI